MNRAGILRFAAWFALYALPALAAAAWVNVDVDVWWHLRAGRWVVENRAVPATDPFSQFGLETRTPWHAYSWLFEVLVYGLHTAFGLSGFVGYRVVLALALVAALHRLVAKREPRWHVAAGLAALGVFSLVPFLLEERPWLFTILFTALTLDAVLDLRQGHNPRGAWLLPVAYALWANLHIQFIYGLFLLTLAALTPRWDDLLGWSRFPGNPVGPGSKARKRLLALTALCYAATLLNPYHARVYLVVLEYLQASDAYRYVNELKSMSFRMPWDWTVLALAGAATFLLGKKNNLSTWDCLLLASTALFAFRTRRDTFFLILGALGILVTARPVPGKTEPLARAWAPGAAALALAVLAGLFGRASLEERLQAGLPARYPVEALRYLKESSAPGPLWNEYDWGGYLMWAWPEVPVSMDGRMNFHGAERVARNLATVEGKPDRTGRPWDQDPELLRARVVLAHQGYPLVYLLGKDDRYQKAYEDNVAVVFVKKR